MLARLSRRTFDSVFSFRKYSSQGVASHCDCDRLIYARCYTREGAQNIFTEINPVRFGGSRGERAYKVSSVRSAHIISHIKVLWKRTRTCWRRRAPWEHSGTHVARSRWHWCSVAAGVARSENLTHAGCRNIYAKLCDPHSAVALKNCRWRGNRIYECYPTISTAWRHRGTGAARYIERGHWLAGGVLLPALRHRYTNGLVIIYLCRHISRWRVR